MDIDAASEAFECPDKTSVVLTKVVAIPLKTYMHGNLREKDELTTSTNKRVIIIIIIIIIIP